MKQISIFLALFAALAAAPAAWAELEFRGLDLGSDDCLLFSATTVLPGDGSFDTLFASDLAKGGTVQLTIYPEHVALIEGGRRLQVQNRFGLFRSDAALSSLGPVAGYPSFARGSSVRSGRLLPSAASPDGAYVLSIVPTSAAFARLVLFDVAKGTETVVAADLEYSFEEMPSRWSPDSRRFIYAKGGSLYYFSIEQFIRKQMLEEEKRRIGPGKIQCVRWGEDSSLYYLRGASLFRILPAEFFTQAFYEGKAGMGALVGKMPFSFDPSFDAFWVSREGSRVILSKGGRNLFLIYLNPDDFGSEARVAALPYLYLQGDTVVRDVLWPDRSQATVFTGSLRDGARSSGAYRLDAPSDPSLIGLAPAVSELPVEGALELVLSPDGSRVAVVTKDGVTIRAYADWALVVEVKAAGALHALWASGDKIVVAGSNLIEAVTLSSGTRSLVALSKADAYGRSENGDIVAAVNGRGFSRPSVGGETAKAAPAGSWVGISAYAALAASLSSTSYRVFLDALGSGFYRNTIMVRSVKALGTKTLFPPPPSAYAVYPDREEPRSPGMFDHGSRIRRREVALVFDALDSPEGLIQVLSVLKDYGIRATFFVNGEFVRQSPGAARLLAGSGHEIGSMFYTSVDLTDAKFRIDQVYIRRGLGTAEELWNQATGTDLSPLWHTPYYKTNSDILEYGASAGYTYVGSDVDPLDWVSKADAMSMPGAYLGAHALVERILARTKPGSIIPLRLGASPGGRDDYLFRELALLVDALVGLGYDVVPISTLIQHAE